MITAFVTLHVADVVDILLVAYLLYKLYMLFKGTLASNIMMAIFFMFVFWMVVRALRMDLMAGIMKQVFSVGLVAIVVVFQPEIRRALSRLGAQGLSRGRSIQEWLFPSAESASAAVDAIVEACSRMSAARQGALIVIPGSDDLSQYEETGDRIDALLTPRLIENIFFKVLYMMEPSSFQRIESHRRAVYCPCWIRCTCPRSMACVTGRDWV